MFQVHTGFLLVNFVMLCIFHWNNRNKVLGSWGVVMSVAAALSAFGSLNGTFFSGGRVCFVAAREGHMVSVMPAELWGPQS